MGPSRSKVLADHPSFLFCWIIASTKNQSPKQCWVLAKKDFRGPCPPPSVRPRLGVGRAELGSQGLSTLLQFNDFNRKTKPGIKLGQRSAKPSS